MKLKSLWLGGLLALVAFLIAVPAAFAAPTTCGAEYDAPTHAVITGRHKGVVVPAGLVCFVANANVSSGIQVGDGATVYVTDSYVSSGITGGDSSNINVTRSEVHSLITSNNGLTLNVYQSETHGIRGTVFTFQLLEIDNSNGVYIDGAFKGSFTNSHTSSGGIFNNVFNLAVTGNTYSSGLQCNNDTNVIEGGNTGTGGNTCAAPVFSTTGLHW